MSDCEAQPSEAQTSSIFVARQPIFDCQGQIWGFELLFRQSGLSNQADFANADVATSQILADGYFLARPGIDNGKRIFINFPKQMLLSGAAFTMPSEMCVIEILETVEPTPEIIEACKALKKAGFTLALDDFVGQPGYEELLKLADIVKVDILGQKPEDVIRIFKTLKPYGCMLLAEKVEDRKFFDLTKKLGFDLFQGFFFKKPEIIPGKKLSSNQTAKLKLMRELAKDDFDEAEMSETISRDLSISYRLLRYVNSASFGRMKKIDSLRQAILLLGQKQLSRWLKVILLSDLDATRKSQAAALTSVQRARFFELLAESNRKLPLDPEAMFFLGIFSLLDVLLGLPMSEVLKELPISDEVKQALQGQDSQARFWLELAECFERADWEKIDDMLKSKSLNPMLASLSYIESQKWTREILEDERQDSA